MSHRSSARSCPSMVMVPKFPGLRFPLFVRLPASKIFPVPANVPAASIVRVGTVMVVASPSVSVPLEMVASSKVKEVSSLSNVQLPFELRLSMFLISPLIVVSSIVPVPCKINVSVSSPPSRVPFNARARIQGNMVVSCSSLKIAHNGAAVRDLPYRCPHLLHSGCPEWCHCHRIVAIPTIEVAVIVPLFVMVSSPSPPSRLLTISLLSSSSSSTPIVLEFVIVSSPAPPSRLPVMVPLFVMVICDLPIP